MDNFEREMRELFASLDQEHAEETIERQQTDVERLRDRLVRKSFGSLGVDMQDRPHTTGEYSDRLEAWMQKAFELAAESYVLDNPQTCALLMAVVNLILTSDDTNLKTMFMPIGRLRREAMKMLADRGITMPVMGALEDTDD